ncbi:LacI family DNA-binding transcriptional regulator [Paenibacillus sp. HJGM_3]|uniref:LacI family DNA-binding transcriptional regulator n=1 Tax=Paenibacillus sp. HJGM_3 TaxID=3379816 RepID=UPI00385FE863
MSVTLKDIAQKANVSVTTVSRVVNHNDTTICSEETQNLIWSLVDELGYKAKRKQAGQVGKSEYKIGYVLGQSVDTAYDPFYSMILKGIEAEAVSTGVTLAFGCFTPGLYRPEAFKKILEDSQVNTVIYMSVEKELLALLIDHQVDLVVAGVEMMSAIPEGADYVGVNFYTDTLKWLQTKVLNRYDRVGYVGNPHTGRYKAYLDAHKLMNKPLNPDYRILIDGWKTDAAKIAVLDYLDSGKELPEVFFCPSDRLAVGVMIALRERGIDVPGRVKVLGFDNIEMAEYVSPRLTTIEVPGYNIGRMAVRAALARVTGERDYPVQFIMPTHFVERESL